MEKKFVHFIGIGGIGVSALARWYKSEGWRVSGSDQERTEITDALRREGIAVHIGPHLKKNLPKRAVLVIYSAAAYRNPEIIEAHRRRILIKSYAEALGELTRQKITIAVAGSHGKSTTTAFIARICIAAGLDPTVIIGTKLAEFNDSNFREGKSPFFIIEADEWNGSFLNYTPACAIVTNIDKEHLDFYKTRAGVENAFLKFLSGVSSGGHIIANKDDAPTKRVVGRLTEKFSDRFRGKVYWYTMRSPKKRTVKKIIQVPGSHNIANALAAWGVAEVFGIPRKTILKGIAGYRGAWRRFQYVGKAYGAPVVADYAHHPTEIKATIAAARERFPGKKLIIVFQPHHYERTKDLFADFAAAFGGSAVVGLLDIYEVSGRERARRDSAVTSARLAEAVSKSGTPAVYLSDMRSLQAFLKAEADVNAAIFMLGAGSIWKLTTELIQ